MEYCEKQVKADCEELLSRFQQSQTVRFEVFSQIWRDMKFEQIFYGGEMHERRPFSRFILDIASRFFLPPFSYQVRAGGLFLLYALTNTQLTDPPEQIRLALKDWEEVKQFEEDSINAKHFDVVLILRKLFAEKLLLFTAAPTTLHYKLRKIPLNMEVSKRFLERMSRPLDLINSELLDEMANIHHMYHKLKISIPEVSENPGSNMARQDLISRLEDTVLQFTKWQMEDMKAGDEDDASVEESSSTDLECSTRARLLSSIKTKAFQTAVQASKSRRHRQVELDSEPVRSSRRPCRPSLKTRTNLHLQLSGDLKKEATTSTQLHHLSTLDSAHKGTEKQPTRFSW